MYEKHIAILEDAKERIVDIGHWTRYSFARDEHDASVKSIDNRACKWCGLGTLLLSRHLILGYPERDNAGVEVRLFIEEIAGKRLATPSSAWNLATVNDGCGTNLTPHSSHNLILDIYEEAIEHFKELEKRSTLLSQVE